DRNDRASPGDGAHRERPEEESGIARVLRSAGRRSEPSEDLKQAVRAAVHAEWRSTVARRGRRRQVWLALAASVTIAALALWMGQSYFATPGVVVASVSRVVGAVESHGGMWGQSQAVNAVSQLHAGQTLSTGASGLIALKLQDGVSLRLDHDTSIAFVNVGRIDVRSGAVYIDSGTEPAASNALRVGTPAGVIWHVGTQYEARIVKDGTRIRVREGRVDLLPEHGAPQTAHVGEQLLIAGSGDIERGAIAPTDAEWSWASSAAPPFEINGRPVRELLTWVGRELGREVVFANPKSEEIAEQAVLSGSMGDLAPSEALSAVLPTTRLRAGEREGKIEISQQ
ncbi:MAG: FecR family protein, partial [Gammaproteobacteria bacterium]